MLKFIESGFDEAPRDPRIEEINRLIKLYNQDLKSGHHSKRSLILLQKIDHLSSQLLNKIKINPSLANNEFMMWFKQEGVHKELLRLHNYPTESKFNNPKLILQLYKTPERIPTLLEWRKKTHHQKNIKNLGCRAVYEKIEPLLHEFQEALAEESPEEITIKALALQEGLLNLQEIPEELAPYCDDLISRTNAFLQGHLEIYPDELSNDASAEQEIILPFKEFEEETFIPLIRDLISKPSVNNLKPKTQFSRGSLNYTQHSVGNNFLWRLENNDEGITYMLQVGEAGNEFGGISTNYLQHHELRSSLELSPYLAREHLFYPTGRIPTTDNQSYFYYNLSIMEYCSEGDLATACARDLHQKIPKPGDIELIETLASRCLPAIALAQGLYLRRKTYMDFKPENFLLDLKKGQERVVTGDLKSIINYDATGRVKREDISTTPLFAPPEYPDAKDYLVQPFMVYQLGLMLYLLATGLSGDAKANALATLREEKSLDFSNFPLFKNTEKGRQLQALISDCLATNPGDRPSLDEVFTRCKNLCPELHQALSPAEKTSKKQEALPSQPHEESVIELSSGLEKDIRLLQVEIAFKQQEYQNKVKAQMLSPLRTGSKKVDLMNTGLHAVSIHLKHFDLTEALDALEVLEIQMVRLYGSTNFLNQEPASYKLIKSIKEEINSLIERRDAEAESNLRI